MKPRLTVEAVRNARLSPLRERAQSADDGDIKLATAAARAHAAKLGLKEGHDRAYKDNDDDGYAGNYEEPKVPDAGPRLHHLSRVLIDANNARLDHAHKYLGQVQRHMDKTGPAPKHRPDDFVSDTHSHLAAAGVALAYAVTGANDAAKHRDLDDVHRHLTALHAHLQHQYGMFNAEGLEKGAKP